MSARARKCWSRRAIAPVGSWTARGRAGSRWLALLGILLASCATRDTQHRVVISVPDQRMALLDKGKPVAVYPVSTSKFGVSDRPNTWGTPLGRMEVAYKIGAGAPSGAVFKDRRFTGEILAPDAPGRDPIVSRIIWLRGREAQNENAFRRFIYIHGTPEERNIGRPASYGCIRMKSKDVIQLFDIIGAGTEVNVVNAPLQRAVVGLTPDGTQIAVMSSPWGRAAPLPAPTPSDEAGSGTN